MYISDVSVVNLPSFAMCKIACNISAKHAAGYADFRDLWGLSILGSVGNDKKYKIQLWFPCDDHIVNFPLTLLGKQIIMSRAI